MLTRLSFFCIVAGSIVLNGCKKDAISDTLFTEVSSAKSGIDFINQLTFTEDYNPYIFKNFLNGGGVAAGDINNDGLPDLFFCGNMVSNKLYLNEGNLKFRDITATSGTGSTDVWSTGVSMVDVNGDGWLDLYVCKSGKPDASNRHNELFINNGDLTFTEVSEQVGIADVGLSTHAVFFDYDRDGDLDCYLLNNSLRSVGNYDLEKDSRLQRDTLGGNKLYRNDMIHIVHGAIQKNKVLHFTDVSAEAGIYGSAIGFGLGVTVADINGDHWPDLYVSNDFFERDYLYINQQDGAFKECLTSSLPEISMGSMGADIADLNEDGWPEIFVTEMLPKDPIRYKTKAVFEHWHKYQQAVNSGYHHQFGRNVLQLHRGLGPDTIPVFSEIGRLAEVHATEWSWGALLADFNNDGRKDIFVANGIYKDLIDMDYVNFYFNPDAVRALIKSKKEVITTMFDAAESAALPNQLFLQDTGFHFIESSQLTGLGIPTFSNGSSYADLDNDGDLELILNNVNMPAMIFENHASQNGAHYIKIKLSGTELNSAAIGSKIAVYACGNPHFMEVNPMRGFQSSVDPVITMGLGTCDRIDSILVTWPAGHQSILRSIQVDTLLLIKEIEDNNILSQPRGNAEPLLIHSTQTLPYTHIENRFSDFDKDRLMFYMTSNEGPKAGVGDLDNDGLEDLVVGGAHGQPAAILFQEKNGTFTKIVSSDMIKDSLSEDICIILKDVNCDQKTDIYISSGGSELPGSSSSMRDRLYLNQGARKFTNAKDFYRPGFGSHNAVCIDDFDQDND
ncbi:MAG: CRTAC1 family protein, partial [Bacteroidota bacterium]|nr:CRTAC1 family protein [Bacteroidota bacterium]